MPTETQAAGMWCPFSRVLSSSSSFTANPVAVAGFNRALITRDAVDETRGIHVTHETVNLPAGSTCIGSACMAWRVQMDTPEPEQHPGYKTARMVQDSPAIPCPDCTGQPWAGECVVCDGNGQYRAWQPVGYCGLAGKPD